MEPGNEVQVGARQLIRLCVLDSDIRVPVDREADAADDVGEGVGPECELRIVREVDVVAVPQGPTSLLFSSNRVKPTTRYPPPSPRTIT